MKFCLNVLHVRYRNLIFVKKNENIAKQNFKNHNAFFNGPFIKMMKFQLVISIIIFWPETRNKNFNMMNDIIFFLWKEPIQNIFYIKTL